MIGIEPPARTAHGAPAGDLLERLIEHGERRMVDVDLHRIAAVQQM